MFGMISPKTIRHVPSPETFAAWTKSRFRSESAWLRRMRASTAHVVRPRISTIGHGPAGREERVDDDQQRQRRDDDEDVGHRVDHVVDPPAAKAESMPSVAAIVVEITAAAKPTASEILAPQIDLREDVVALVGRAEPVLPARRQAGERDDLVRRVLRDHRRAAARRGRCRRRRRCRSTTSGSSGGGAPTPASGSRLRGASGRRERDGSMATVSSRARAGRGRRRTRP